MAIRKACVLSSGKINNTGKECDISMGATSMLLAVPPSLTWTLADLENPLDWLTNAIHDYPEKRVYPLFGMKAPINEIDNDTEDDTVITLDDGTKVWLKYGMYNRTFATISGGLCYARSLASFLKSGYSVVEIDGQGNMLMCRTGKKDNQGRDLYRGLLTTFMYAPSPILADFNNTPYKNRFSYSFNPVELVNNGEVFVGASELLSSMGLLNVRFEDPKTSEENEIHIVAKTNCADSNLASLVGASLLNPANFIVRNSTDTQSIVVSSVTESDGEIVLAGTFPTGDYIVKGPTPAVWLANDVDGYDPSEAKVTVTIV